VTGGCGKGAWRSAARQVRGREVDQIGGEMVWTGGRSESGNEDFTPDAGATGTHVQVSVDLREVGNADPLQLVIVLNLRGTRGRGGRREPNGSSALLLLL
jgi:hypothetical protein